MQTYLSRSGVAILSIVIDIVIGIAQLKKIGNYIHGIAGRNLPYINENVLLKSLNFLFFDKHMLKV